MWRLPADHTLQEVVQMAQEVEKKRDENEK